MKKRECRFISVRVKILWSLVFVSVLLVISVVFLSYALAMERVERIGMRLSGQYVISAGEDLKDKLTSLYEITDRVIELDALRDMAQLQGNPQTQAEYAGLDKSIAEAVAEIVPYQNRNAASFSYIGIYMKNGYHREIQQNTGFSFSGYEECVDYFVQSGAEVADLGYNIPQWQLCRIRENGEQIPVYLRFLYEPVTLEKTGIVVFGLRNEVLCNVYSGYVPEAYILTYEGKIIASRSGMSVGTGGEETESIIAGAIGSEGANGSFKYYDTQGKEQTVFYYRLPSMRSYLIVPFELEEAEWGKEMESYIVTIVLVSACLLLVAIALSLILSRGLTKSVSSLTGFLGQVEQGNEDLRYHKKSNDEIGKLGDKINQMLDELKRLNLSREEEMCTNQLVELQLMQQQINPHLLYNTLDSVLWGIQQHNYENATEVLHAMSEYFKLSLSRGQMEIPLSNEIRMVENYLTIQNKARRKEFQFVCTIPQELQDYPIIKLTLQPLVENSVMHGFSGYRDNGIVSIDARCMNDCITITVEDNGIGMEQHELDKINSVLKLPTCPKEHHHFGLYNINRRIVQRYGKEYGLYIESEISEYTRISISLPGYERA